MFVLDDPEPYILGNEPVYREGEVVGRITSGFFGHTVGRSVGMGYVRVEPDAEPIASGSYELEMSTERFPATRKPPSALRSQRPPGTGLAAVV